MRKSIQIHENVNLNFFTLSQKTKIQVQVLKYVHKELLKKPTVYRQRRKNSRQIVSYREVAKYLKKHWQTTRTSE